MNANDLFRSIGEIDEQTLINTEVSKNRNTNRIVVRLIAASLAIVLMVFGFSYLFPAETPGQSISSWFVITAQAAEGDWKELDLNGCFNSAPPESMHSIFPDDAPLFSFFVKRSNLENDQEAYSGFIVNVSCYGKSTDFFNKHVSVYHQYSRTDADVLDHRIHIVGWFEEATDIIISIIDEKTNELIEEQTVHVCYVPESQAYQLKVTNVETKNMNE